MQVSEPARQLAGFKPPIVEVDLDAGRPVLDWKIECKLLLPGAWFLSSLPKRGIPFPASFTNVRPKPAQTTSPRPVWSPTTIVSARAARLVTDLSRTRWDFRPRSRFRKSVSSFPLTVTPLVRPVTAGDLSVNSKWKRGWRRSGFFPFTLRLLPEFPTFNPKPEEVIWPEYCSPVSKPICATNWVRRSQLALPVDRSSRIQGLQTRKDHVPLRPKPAAWSTKFEAAAQGSEPGLAITGLTIMDSCRPTPACSSPTGLDMSGPLLAILNPGPTRLRSAVTPSSIRPSLQSSVPNTPSLREVSPSPHVFALRQIRDDAIPEAETGAVGPRLWFAVRVPSPNMLETPTPLDSTKRPHYVPADRPIRFAAIPAELVGDPAGLPTASRRALGAAPDLFSDSAAFRAFGPSRPRESVPQIPELQPPPAPVVQRGLAPVDQLAAMAESFLPHNMDRFPMGPAILWTSTFEEAFLREARPSGDVIRPVPYSIEESFIPHKVNRFPIRPAAPSIATLHQTSLRESGPAADVIRPVPDRIEESFLPHKVNRFRRRPAIPWTPAVNEAVLRETTAPLRRVLPVPDSPQAFVFQNRSRFGPSGEFHFALPTGATFAAYPPQPYEPTGELGGPPDAARVIMPENALKPGSKPALGTSEIEEVLRPVRVAPARASFCKIANPESMHSLFDTDLRDRIFNPILPQLPRTRLRPATVEVGGSRLQESRVFAPVSFRWQRQRKVRDRGAPWKIPARIGLRPPPAPPYWPGSLPVAEWVDRPTRFH